MAQTHFGYITQEYIDRALREDPLPWPDCDEEKP